MAAGRAAETQDSARIESSTKLKRTVIHSAFVVLCLLSCGPLSEAHLLNMTRVSVSIDPTTHRVEMDLEVDLTRMLGGPKSYYKLTQTPDEERKNDLATIAGALERGLQLTCDGGRIDLNSTEVVLPNLDLEDFKATYAAPMTRVRLEGSLPQGGGELRFRAETNLTIENPIAITFREPQEGRTMTRWVESGEVSRPFPVAAQVVVVDREGSSDPSGQREDSSTVDWMASAWIYLKLGFVHILPSGRDHILFVLGLFLLAVRWKPLLAQVTCFTVAHTITLGLGIIGFLSPPAKVVEPLIAVSIAYVGIENIFKTRPGPARLVIVSLFGLVHGLGFAGVLREIGLPDSSFVTALVFFNIGVEGGQIGVLLCAFAAIGWFRRWRHFRKAILIPCSAAISVIGISWAVMRIAA